MSLDKIILDRIEKERLWPLPHWFFAVKKVLCLIFISVSILVSAVSASFVAYYYIKKSGTIMLSAALLVWLAPAVISFFAAKYLMNQIGKLYRLPNIIAFPFLASIVLLLGFSLFSQGGTQKLESKLEKVPAYGRLVPVQMIQDREGPAGFRAEDTAREEKTIDDSGADGKDEANKDGDYDEKEMDQESGRQTDVFLEGKTLENIKKDEKSKSAEQRAESNEAVEDLDEKEDTGDEGSTEESVEEEDEGEDEKGPEDIDDDFEEDPDIQEPENEL